MDWEHVLRQAGQALDELGLRGDDFTLCIRGGKLARIEWGHLLEPCDPANREVVLERARGNVRDCVGDVEARLETTAGLVTFRFHNFLGVPKLGSMGIEEVAKAVKDAG